MLKNSLSREGLTTKPWKGLTLHQVQPLLVADSVRVARVASLAIVVGSVAEVLTISKCWSHQVSLV